MWGYTITGDMPGACIRGTKPMDTPVRCINCGGSQPTNATNCPVCLDRLEQVKKKNKLNTPTHHRPHAWYYRAPRPAASASHATPPPPPPHTTKRPQRLPAAALQPVTAYTETTTIPPPTLPPAQPPTKPL